MLAVADGLSRGTIDTVLAKSDLERGIEAPNAAVAGKPSSSASSSADHAIHPRAKHPPLSHCPFRAYLVCPPTTPSPARSRAARVLRGDPGQIAGRAKDICTRLARAVEDAQAEYEQLAAQDNTDLLDEALGGKPHRRVHPGADRPAPRHLRLACTPLWLAVHDQEMPASYGITGRYDFLNNVRHIIGP